MKVTFLGCGDGFSIEQGHNSALLTFADTNLCIDFPESNHLGLHQLGMKLNQVENIFVTHLHEDHINGLQKLALFHRVYPGKAKPKLYVPAGLIEDLWQCLRHGLELTTRGKRVFEDYFDIECVEKDFTVTGVQFELVQTLHVPEMLSYGLLCKPHFYFSGDTRLDESYIRDIVEEVQTIFHECHMQDDQLPSHTSLEELLTLPKSIQSKMILMHYVDDYVPLDVREKFHEEHTVRLAEPLRSYEL
ncbi:Ribonuclease BN, tRNA processing enzyme [Paenibacillus sp. yr247]|uniref:MBL fold metallo-hydrolase n=1 Tax=Paenibacillus sp. yr247 TaxID=1761880 RepID=UPI00088F2CBB|nr:MBL fold metallo-hydrolase [Paenibacillus sp. yr247]SDN52962.1 Ribonuclease BN, tRNA processing enzyme [Paenibacillus sp. yr247]